jgi:hypothetical protein
MEVGLCVWSGPEFLRQTTCLEAFYPEHHEFFCHTLGVTDATWKTIMGEAQHIKATDSLEHISQVLVALSRHLEKEDHVPFQIPLKAKNADSEAPNLAEKFEALSRPILGFLPIKHRYSEYTFDYLSTGHERGTWFIADRLHLRQSFDGLIPLLALTVASVAKVSFLIKILKLEHRLLSKVAHGIPRIRGSSKECPRHTLSLRAKSRSIAR